MEDLKKKIDETIIEYTEEIEIMQEKAVALAEQHKEITHAVTEASMLGQQLVGAVKGLEEIRRMLDDEAIEPEMEAGEGEGNG